MNCIVVNLVPEKLQSSSNGHIKVPNSVILSLLLSTKRTKRKKERTKLQLNFRQFLTLEKGRENQIRSIFGSKILKRNIFVRKISEVCVAQKVLQFIVCPSKTSKILVSILHFLETVKNLLYRRFNFSKHLSNLKCCLLVFNHTWKRGPMAITLNGFLTVHFEKINWEFFGKKTLFDTLRLPNKIFVSPHTPTRVELESFLVIWVMKRNCLKIKSLLQFWI